MSYCLLVPHYNHERQFMAFLPSLLATGLPCIVIDDGSDQQSLEQVREEPQGYRFLGSLRDALDKNQRRFVWL